MTQEDMNTNMDLAHVYVIGYRNEFFLYIEHQ